VLLLPAVLVTATTVAALALALRGRLGPLREPAAAPPVSPLVRPAAAVLAALGVAYVVATSLRAPVGVVAVAGAVALAAVVATDSPKRLRRLRADVSWSVLFVIVQGLEDTGVTGAALHWWLGVGSGSTPSPVSAFVGAAAGSNLINNLPMTLVTLNGLHPLGAAAVNPPLGLRLARTSVRTSRPSGPWRRSCGWCCSDRGASASVRRRTCVTG
jgi:arsenical pump membrane protein